MNSKRTRAQKPISSLSSHSDENGLHHRASWRSPAGPYPCDTDTTHTTRLRRHLEDMDVKSNGWRNSRFQRLVRRMCYHDLCYKLLCNVSRQRATAELAWQGKWRELARRTYWMDRDHSSTGVRCTLEHIQLSTPQFMYIERSVAVE